MKLSAFMMAFIISTAVHVGALTSNLIHVNAESIPHTEVRPVKLHILPAAIRKPSAPELQTEKKNVEKSRAVNSETLSAKSMQTPAQPKPATQEVIISRVAPPEKQPVAGKPSPLKPSIARIKSPIPDPVTLPVEKVPEPPATVVSDFLEHFQDARTETRRPFLSAAPGRDNDACDGCFASPAAASFPAPKRLEAGGMETGPAAPARIILSSKPEYPRYSRLHREEGTTVLSVEILSDGKLGNVEVVQSSGYRRLDRAAVKGMQSARLVPAVKDGLRVASTRRIAVRFDLEDWEE
ncbi:MAG: energy transducer TonB [Acidobacteria bacterium]|nr:energy transducer TonB [Acidobacteriota bacterium]